MTAPRQSAPRDEEPRLDQARSQHEALSLRVDDLLERAGLSTEHLEVVIARASRDPLVRKQLEAISQEAPARHGAQPAGPAAMNVLVRNPRALRA